MLLFSFFLLLIFGFCFLCLLGFFACWRVFLLGPFLYSPFLFFVFLFLAFWGFWGCFLFVFFVGVFSSRVLGGGAGFLFLLLGLGVFVVLSSVFFVGVLGGGGVGAGVLVVVFFFVGGVFVRVLGVLGVLGCCCGRVFLLGGVFWLFVLCSSLVGVVFVPGVFVFGFLCCSGCFFWVLLGFFVSFLCWVLGFWGVLFLFGGGGVGVFVVFVFLLLLVLGVCLLGRCLLLASFRAAFCAVFFFCWFFCFVGGFLRLLFLLGVFFRGGVFLCSVFLLRVGFSFSAADVFLGF
ncbi:hypothetical protein [Klebsiella pneumoniae]|uniref:hypothetical protein n=1 Tax=Klebsiella pneumoniae TaxID=573 RepID=UPI0006509AC6|nr:hypothetical protein [Klebsiella pneumoniae]